MYVIVTPAGLRVADLNIALEDKVTQYTTHFLTPNTLEHNTLLEIVLINTGILI